MQDYYLHTAHLEGAIKRFVEEATTWKGQWTARFQAHDHQTLHTERTEYTQRRTYISDQLAVLQTTLHLDTEAGPAEERKKLRIQLQKMKRTLYHPLL